MRILAAAPYYSPDGGGLERYAHAILARLKERGHDVRAMAFGSESSQTTQDGILVDRMAPMTRLGNAPVHPAFASRVADSIRAERPDVVIAHTPVPFVAEMAYRAARKAGIPFVVTYHAGRLRGSSRFLDGLAAIDRVTMERGMLAGAARLIAVSPYVANHALRHHKERVEVIPPGVDHTFFIPTRNPVPTQDLLFVAPLDTSYAWKGLDVLWEAYVRLRRTHPNVRLTLVGRGDRVAEFHAKGQKVGGVRILGRLAEVRLVKEYQGAITVLPSTTDAESFGMVLAEANACGRPVVASRVGGIPGFVRHRENGLLVEPGDARALEVAIAKLLDNPELANKMGQRGREIVVAHHDWDVLTGRTEEVLEDAAGMPHQVVATVA